MLKSLPHEAPASSKKKLQKNSKKKRLPKFEQQVKIIKNVSKKLHDYASKPENFGSKQTAQLVKETKDMLVSGVYRIEIDKKKISKKKK